jgi:hypothetical protein
MEHPRRALQQVSMVLTHKAVVTWIIEDEANHGTRGLPTRTVRALLSRLESQLCPRSLLVGAS